MSRSSRLLALFLLQRRSLVLEAARLTGDGSVAEDVVQEAWLRLVHATPAREMSEPASYLRRVVRNLALDEYRRRRRREQVAPGEAADLAQVASPAASAEQAIIAAQELALVTAELRKMRPQMRRAVELHRLSGATLREIADDLGVSVTTAHKLVTTGVERCRACLLPS